MLSQRNGVLFKLKVQLHLFCVLPEDGETSDSAQESVSSDCGGRSPRQTPASGSLLISVFQGAHLAALLLRLSVALEGSVSSGMALAWAGQCEAHQGRPCPFHEEPTWAQ